MRIGSISKSITAVSLFRLWEEGKIDLDQTVGEYLDPEIWPKDKADITVRQLLTHTSGIRHYEKKKSKDEKEDAKKESENQEFQITQHFETTKDSLELFKNDELLYKPGEAFSYTTHGYSVLAAVIEAVAKEPFDKHLQRLFKDLGLHNTYLDKNQPLIPNRSRSYQRNSHHRLINAPHVDNSYKWAGGGLLSNVVDLVKFGNAMLYSYQSNQQDPKVPSGLGPVQHVVYNPGPYAAVNQASDNKAMERRQLPGFLKQGTMKTMWEPSVDYKDGSLHDQKEKDNWHYAMGWAVLPSVKRHAFCRDQKFIASHTGGSMGASSVLVIIPREPGKGESPETGPPPPDGIVVAMICNMESVGLSATAREVAKAFEPLRRTDEAYRVQKVYQI